ncbi:hypothetical protein EYA84_02095 [Verrucosispora sp. SN26_14.1]|uniref:DUF7213 family protein n=1 Tax=Verrucosispora sp. SN26_14.1 TaxID=2527879 RepID=UPI0010336338|nr:hypothetical protein [Verrucosispora sp. SN26_14.1]TBL44255.1 hypothetical protein EYA84_02095 [Verrucosispora sp. SN26_14.1]
MPRTPDQVAADEALTAAIEQALHAYSDGEPWVLTEYVVVTSQHRFDDDGEGLTAVGTLYRDGDVPLHRALGLVDYAAVRMRKPAAEDDEG